MFIEVNNELISVNSIAKATIEPGRVVLIFTGNHPAPIEITGPDADRVAAELRAHVRKPAAQLETK